jgi:diguanylate cyclase (GGDEF)-like protein
MDQENTSFGGNPARAPRSLGRRLVIATLGFCLLFTCITVGVRSWFAWQNNLNNMKSELALIDQVFRATLSKAIWDMDTESLETQLDSVSNAAPVGRVALYVFRAGREPEHIVRSRAEAQPTSAAPSLRRELTFSPYIGAIEHVGTLEIEANETLLRERLYHEIIVILITQVVQSLLLAGLIMWMFNSSVTVHVRHIARHLDQLSPETLKNRLRLERSAGRRDELSLLEARVNDVQDKLSDHLEEQREYEGNLAAHRDRLAELVEERTAELKQANAQLKELSRSDPLTGIANRREFDEVKEQEFRRALRSDQPLTVMMCDIDFFKAYNDFYGHAAGDACLREVATVLRQSFSRAGELVARLGGEEFVVLLPGLDRPEAMAAAGRLTTRLSERAVPHAASAVSPHITLSIGVATLDARTMDHFDQLLNQADLALYRAKQSGRNRVAC